MASGLVKIIKEVAMDAVDNANMSDLRFGVVISSSPLKVRVTNQFIIPETMLIVPQHLTDYEIEITTTPYGWATEYESGGSDAASFASHSHKINQTKKTLKVHGALKVNDKVALLRKQGGQSYFVLDRLIE